MKTSFDVPLVAFCFRMPSDGLPCLSDWLTHSLSILSSGYEKWRESIEIKPSMRHDQGGGPMAFGSVEATKGTGRISILLFTVLQTYTLKNQLEPEDLDSFKL